MLMHGNCRAATCQAASGARTPCVASKLATWQRPAMAATLGDRILEQRSKRGLGLSELAKLAKVGLSTLMRYENGQRGTKSPPLQTVERIARALNVRVEYLQHGTGDVDADPMARHATLSEHPQWPALAADAARVAPELERWIEEAGSMRVGRSGQPKRIDVRYILDIASALQRAHERQTA